MDWMEGFADDLKGNEVLGAMDGPETLAKTHLALIESSGKPWKESFSEEFGTEENLKALEGYESQEDLAKAHLEMKSGQPVVPENPEDYELPAPEGGEVSEDLKAFFTPLFHKGKMSQDQVNVIGAGWNEYIGKIVKDQHDAEVREHETAENALKDQWKGPEYEKNKEAANVSMGHLAKAAGLTDEDVQYVSDKYGNDPRLVRMMHIVSTKISEDDFDSGSKKKAGDKEQSGEDFIKGVFKEGDKGG